MNLLDRLFGKKRPSQNSDQIDGTDGIGDSGKVNHSGIVSFSYHRDGTIGRNSYSYFVFYDNGKYFFSYDHIMLRDYGEMKTEVSDETVSALYDIYAKNKVYRWDGFRKTNRAVRDGTGFSVSFGFSDGKDISASGNNCFPNGYRDFVREIDELFAPICAELKETQRQKLIEKGVSGDLKSVIVLFKQHGNSGNDSYEVQIYAPEIRTQNFEVTVMADRIEKYYCSLPAEALRLKELDSVIRKNNIITWLDRDGHSDDPDNSEWFQIAFGYETGHINACGTEHPEGYDRFRNDFLEWLDITVRNARDNYGMTEYLD